MAFNYDDFYKSNPQGLGAPTQIFVDAFAGLSDRPMRVLDVGCGQGRDALFIARLGHDVVGVDLSAHGIAQMCEIARAEGLNIKGITANITTFSPEGLFDVILIDRTLHMLEQGARLAVLSNLLRHISPKGHVLIADERANMDGFKQVFTDDGCDWAITVDKGGVLFTKRL